MLRGERAGADTRCEAFCIHAARRFPRRKETKVLGKVHFRKCAAEVCVCGDRGGGIVYNTVPPSHGSAFVRSVPRVLPLRKVIFVREVAGKSSDDTLNN